MIKLSEKKVFFLIDKRERENEVEHQNTSPYFLTFVHLKKAFPVPSTVKKNNNLSELL
jgi:hypothetical protein